MRRAFRWVRVSCTLLGLLVLAVSFTPLVPMVASRLSVDWYQGDADVLVVLGGSMLVDGTGPQASLGYDSYLRCTYAAWNLQQHRYAYVVLSGPDGLAEAMAGFLAARETKSDRLLMENAARTTSQNAAFVKKILDHQIGLPPHPKIALLTSDYHSRRAQLGFQHLGMPVRVIPVPDAGKRGQFIRLRWSAFLDEMEELVKCGFYQLSGQLSAIV
jgi:uncharacterized SAM-binding protein YcdF (DUF218 family)